MVNSFSKDEHDSKTERENGRGKEVDKRMGCCCCYYVEKTEERERWLLLLLVMVMQRSTSSCDLMIKGKKEDQNGGWR